MRRIGTIDIGGTKTAIGIVREDGAVLERREFPTRAERGFEDAIARMEQMLRGAIESCGSIAGIGIGCPGPLNYETGVIGEVGTLPGWRHGRLGAEMAARFNVSVAVENDADASALAEYAWGAVPAAGTLIYVTVSTGIGGGVVQAGRLMRGVDGSHPELGHQSLDPSGPLCYCGISGCWESLASGTAMSAYFRTLTPEQGEVAAAEICERARLGDRFALRAVHQTRRYLCLGVANLVTLFAPDVICLGGGVMRSSDLFLDDVRGEVRRLCTQVPAEAVSIKLSAVGHDVGLLGAAQGWLLRHG
jgi:glucokinase